MLKSLILAQPNVHTPFISVPLCVGKHALSVPRLSLRVFALFFVPKLPTTHYPLSSHSFALPVLVHLSFQSFPHSFALGRGEGVQAPLFAGLRRLFAELRKLDRRQPRTLWWRTLCADA
jgi:hypothetical protein